MYDNKLGLFIHWGIYALTECHEQAFARLNMSREEYEGLAARFNPVKFDAERIARMAKAAGMEYICFTAKHHDGFCMWDTATTDFSIMHTPFGRDALRELCDAARQEGLRLSIYYSIPDWHHPDARNGASTHQWKSHPEGDFDRYREYLTAQITELMTNYGEIYTLFWDIPPHIDAPEINALVRRLQPGILINDRGFDAGDFSTPEREEAEDGRLMPYSRRTEACNSLDAISWGWRRESDYYSLRHMLSSVDGVMARGGNYLLNVGPTAEGEIPPEQQRRLARIGDWFFRVKEGFAGVSPDEFSYAIHRAPKFIALCRENTTWFHFPEGISADGLCFTARKGNPRRVVCLNSGKEIAAEETDLPNPFDMETGRSREKILHLRGIPVDEFPAEPIVLRVDWQ
ncbi:MAG: alpha-L-fucosidase [Clostridia bacterium]|nr:alpha-L-fucosidase [Clostridia bacterium]